MPKAAFMSVSVFCVLHEILHLLLSDKSNKVQSDFLVCNLPGCGSNGEPSMSVCVCQTVLPASCIAAYTPGSDKSTRQILLFHMQSVSNRQDTYVFPLASCSPSFDRLFHIIAAQCSDGKYLMFLPMQYLLLHRGTNLSGWNLSPLLMISASPPQNGQGFSFSMFYPF